MAEHVAFDHAVSVRLRYALPGGYGVMVARRTVTPSERDRNPLVTPLGVGQLEGCEPWKLEVGGSSPLTQTRKV